MMVKGVKIFPCVAVAIGPCICECVIYRSKPIPVALVAMAEWRNGFFFFFFYIFSLFMFWRSNIVDGERNRQKTRHKTA